MSRFLCISFMIVGMFCTLSVINPQLMAQELNFDQQQFDLTLNDGDMLLNNRFSYALYFPGQDSPVFIQFKDNSLRFVYDSNSDPDLITWQRDNGFFTGLETYFDEIPEDSEARIIPRIDDGFLEISLCYAYPEQENPQYYYLRFFQKDLINSGDWEAVEAASLNYEIESESGFVPRAAFYSELNGDDQKDWFILGQGDVQILKIFNENDNWEFSNIQVIRPAPNNYSFNVDYVNVVEVDGVEKIVACYNESYATSEGSWKDSYCKMFMVDYIREPVCSFTAINGATECTGIVSTNAEGRYFITDYSGISSGDIVNNLNGSYNLERETLYAGPFNCIAAIWDENSTLQGLGSYSYQIINRVSYGEYSSDSYTTGQTWKMNEPDGKFYFVNSVVISERPNTTFYSTQLFYNEELLDVLVVQQSNMVAGVYESVTNVYHIDEDTGLSEIDDLCSIDNSDLSTMYGSSIDGQAILKIQPVSIYGGDTEYRAYRIDENGVDFINCYYMMWQGGSKGMLADWNGNGIPDVLIGQSYYRNNSNADYPEDNYERIIISSIPMNMNYSAIFDYNHDGLPDIVDNNRAVYINACESAVDEQQNGRITEYELVNLYPNPFNSTLHVSYTLPQKSIGQIAVFDILGRQVYKLKDLSGGSGTQKLSINFDQLSSGTYFLKAQLNDKTEARKIVLVK